MSYIIRRFRHIGSASLIVAAALGLWICPSTAVKAGAADDKPLKLFQLANRCVLRLVVKGPALDGGASTVDGSAVALALEPPEAPRFLILATAYHVLAGTVSFTVWTPSGTGQIATSTPDTECFVDRSREIVFLRISLTPGQGQGIKPIRPEPAMPAPKRDGPLGPPRAGMAFGYPYAPHRLDSRRVDFLGEVEAQTIDLVRKIEFRPSKGELPPGLMRFQLLGDQATLEGMSGGLVVDWDERFAGLIYGRRTDQFNLLIPAEQVLDAWHRARKQNAWQKLGEEARPLQQPSLFNGGADEAITEDRLDWGTLEGLSVLLGDDPLGAIQRFQEIVVTPPQRFPPPDLHIYVLDTETIPNREHKVTFWVNGTRAELDPVFRRITLSLKDLPGETMVTVIKESGQVNDFELGKFLLPSKVYLEFQYEGEKPFRRVIRSLPVIAQSYPLFITVVNNPLVKPRPGKPRPSENARLAIRLDYLEAVLNQAPFNLEVGEKNAQAVYEGRFRLNDHDAWRLRAVSPQRLGLNMNGEVLLRQGQVLSYQGITLQPRAGPDKVWPPKFTLSGRLQFPYEMPGRDAKGNTLGVALSARATGANGSGSLRVDVRPPLQFDIAGIVRHLFTSFVNGRLISNLQTHRLDDEKIAPFLDRLGFACPSGWASEIRRAVFVNDPDGQHDWFILSFRLDPQRGGAGGEPPASQNLLAPPTGPPGRVIDLQAWGVPGCMVARFPGLEKASPVVSASLKAARLDHMALSLDLDPQPSEWFKGLESPGELFLFRDNGVSVAKRIQKALAYSVSRAKAIELRAQAKPGLASEVLRAALNRHDLKLAVDEAQASLDVVADQGRDGTAVNVTMSGGPFTLTIPEDQEIPIGAGNTVRGVRLKVSGLKAHGRIDAPAVQADVEAELAVKQLKAGGAVFDDAKGRAIFAIDSAPDRRVLGKATVEGIEFGGQLAGIPFRVQVNGKIPVQIDRDLNFRFDPTLLKSGR